VLGGADCHFDNLIACGEHPVLVDTEMLFQPALAGNGSSDAGTILRTGLLPSPKVDTLDFSGLGCVSDQSTSLRIPEWQQVNTDGMKLCFRAATIHPSRNVPVLRSVVISPLDYVEEVIEGFREMYRCVLKNRERLLGPQSPLALIAAQKVRVLARATIEYHLVLSQTLHPNWLRTAGNGVRFRNSSRFPLLEPSETSALQRMDVPRFLINTTATSLTAPDGIEACAYFSQSGVHRVISEIEKLSEDHLEQQAKLIQFAWSFSSLSRIS
jgi:lantibiotic modifying enzyme